MMHEPSSIHWFRITAKRFASLFSTRRRESELDAELRAHLEALTEENIRRGMNPEDACYAARREFGGVEQTKERYRETRGLPMLEVLLQDLRFGLRALRKNPGFSAVALLTLALGIGANTAIFSVVNAVLLKPLPFPDPRRIVAMYQTAPQIGVTKNGVSYLNLADWQTQSHSFEAMGGFHLSALTLTGSGDSEIIPSATVTSSVFSVLGVRPIAGRLLLPADDEPAAAPVVLMSERLWRRRFGAAPDLVGRTVTLDKRAFTVAGILPAAFQFPFQLPPGDLWIPLRQDPLFTELLPRRGGHYLSAIARLKRGVTLRQAEAELAAIQARLDEQYPVENAGWGSRLAPLHQEVVGDVQLSLLVLLGAVALVLLIACANVASLLLARATSRSRELAVRAALGAGRKRIVRQLLTESLLLGVIGGALGAAAAWWIVKGLASALPSDLPRIHAIQVDQPVLAFTLALSLLVSLLFGLAPALHVTSSSLLEGLKESARGTSEGAKRLSLRSGFIAGEVALAVVLLTGAGLLLRSFLQLQDVFPGFRAEGLLTAAATLPQSQYAKPEDWARFYRRAVEGVKTLPGVTGAAVVVPLPMTSGRINIEFNIVGVSQAPGEMISANYAAVSADYFEVLGIPLLRGRTFENRDDATAPKICVISEAFARRYFPSENPSGKRLVFGFPTPAEREIVGIVADVKQSGLDEPAEPEMYAPFEQSPMWEMNFAVRTAGDPVTLTSAVREKIQEVDKDLPVVDMQPMTAYLHDSVAQPRFRTSLVGFFGAVALLLAAIGIYGVISYTVTQRATEIGIRIALGAQPAQVLRLIVFHGMKPVILGLAIGIACAFALTRLLESLLFGVTPSDPLTFVGVVVLLLAVSLSACCVPALRGIRVDPLVALRYE
jgi:predicted permease